jgi:hypothetical protein
LVCVAFTYLDDRNIKVLILHLGVPSPTYQWQELRDVTEDDLLIQTAVYMRELFSVPVLRGDDFITRQVPTLPLCQGNQTVNCSRFVNIEGATESQYVLPPGTTGLLFLLSQRAHFNAFKATAEMNGTKIRFTASNFIDTFISNEITIVTSPPGI